MRVDPAKLIQFIVCQATEFGASLSPIKVVKFLYLADLYHARENKGGKGWGVTSSYVIKFKVGCHP